MAEFLCDFFKSDIGTELVKRERIVRCRDCKHAYEHGGELDCSHFIQWDYYSDQPGHWPVDPDGFCAWGERSE